MADWTFSYPYLKQKYTLLESIHHISKVEVLYCYMVPTIYLQGLGGHSLLFATTPKYPCKKDIGTICCHIIVKYYNFKAKEKKTYH